MGYRKDMKASAEKSAARCRCEDCMDYRNGTCLIPRKGACEDFRAAVNVPKEEMDMWPEFVAGSYGDRYWRRKKRS